MKKLNVKFGNLFTQYRLSFLFVAIYLLIRLTFIFFPFWGLEYEDSFIYNDTARSINYNYNFQSTPFKCQTCASGNYIDCEEYCSYGGHLITVPLILSMVNTIFGYSSFNLFIVNFIFSIASLLLISYFQNSLFQGIKLSLITFIVFMVITPFLPVFNTSGLSETASSFLVLGFFLCTYQLFEKNFNPNSKLFWFSLAFFLCAVLTKRENLVLQVFILSLPIFRKIFKLEIDKKNFLAYLLISISISIILIISLGLFSVESNEGTDIGTMTFSISFFLTNIWQLLLAMLNPSYWGISGICFLIALIYVTVSRKINLPSSLLLFLICLFILVYSSHYRSYYQVLFNDSVPFDTLRYSINYSMLIFIFIQFSLFDYYTKNIQKKITILKNRIILITIFVALLINSIYTRITFNQVEYLARINPVKRVLNVATINDIIITDIPMVLRAYSNANQKIVDLYACNNNTLNEILKKPSKEDIFILLRKDHNTDFYRYNKKIDFSKFKNINPENDDYLLLIRKN